MRTWFWTRTSASSWSTLAQRRTWCLGNCLEHSVVPWNTAALKFCWETGINKRIFMVLLDLKECYSILVTILIGFTVDQQVGYLNLFSDMKAQSWRCGPLGWHYTHWSMEKTLSLMLRRPSKGSWSHHFRSQEVSRNICSSPFYLSVLWIHQFMFYALWGFSYCTSPLRKEKVILHRTLKFSQNVYFIMLGETLILFVHMINHND